MPNRFRLWCTSRWRAIGLPTDEALRRSRRRNTDLRVFFVISRYTPPFFFRFPIIFQLDRATPLMTWHFAHGIYTLGIKQKNTGCHTTYDTRFESHTTTKIPSVTNTYDTRLISVQAGQMPQAAYLDPSIRIKLGPFGNRNHSIQPAGSYTEFASASSCRSLGFKYAPLE